MNETGEFLSRYIRGKAVLTDSFLQLQLFADEETATSMVGILNGEYGLDYEVRELYARVE
jgi:hypothetical protein